ncbi:deoxynucleotide monophosphate kinase [Ensifer sp. ENS04]|uniref:deoxynucleotide monophosphate kinase family protein n=1 Tax=Ensifer sp. ENS04 TaxID=2769281 RepID=UPI0017831332|nr:deoxynucleotide monophosphate kinase [Ensifer sp. ENS04]MBD9542980.1 deoxynucleotide monophosphate kinase [Ensifer sp. ENS04]
MINSDNWSPWTASGELTHVPPVGTEMPDYAALGREAIARFPKVHAALAASERAANDNYPRLVALTGAAGSGKSTATRFLVERHGYTLVKFAGPLKDMLRAIGLSEEQIEGGLKEEPCEWLQGATPRHAMQTLGTQWGRACIGEGFWSSIWRRRVETALALQRRVVVDDCRFPNEAEAVRQLGGMIIKLEGRGGIAGEHASEAGCGQHDAVVFNDDGLVDLYAGVEEEVRRWAA